MNVRSAKTILRDNWHLTALLVGLLAAGGYLQYAKSGAAPSSEGVVTPEAKSSAAPLANETPGRPTPQDNVRATIAKHKAQFENNPADKDAPALLNAMGNLYRYKLGDYPNAIQAYELLLHDYPNWEGIRTTLISLATCYQHVGNRDGVRTVYEVMLKHFPPESQEFQYAKAELSH